MKKTKLIGLLMGICTLVGMNSCLNDDSDNGLTQKEVTEAMNAMKGNYTGTLKWKASTDNNYDSLNNVSWTVNDTAIIIHDFPVNSLAVGVASGEINDSLRNAMKAAPAQELTCAIAFYNTSDFLNPYCVMNIMPYSIVMKDAIINTHNYNLQVNFINNVDASRGYFNNEMKAMEFYMCTYNLQVDKQTQMGNFNKVYYKFVSKSKQS